MRVSLFRVGTVAAVLGLTVPAASAQTPTETIAAATASAVPDETLGWLPVDYVRHPLNPVYTFAPAAGQTAGTDRVFPTVMRVDDKLPNPLARWYLWVWRHGLQPRTAANGGRLVLLTANSLEGPWTNRGYVTPENMSPTGWGPYSWTGGDVVWSPEHRKFFSVPHAYRTVGPGLDTFLMESGDGVSWVRSSDQPNLPAGPEWYDSRETGYGKLLRETAADGSERWVWLYRADRWDAATPENKHYTFAVATAPDIYGPWTKAAYNPVFDPFVGNAAAPNGGGGLIGLDAFARYEGTYQMLWQDFIGNMYLSRSTNLRAWEDFVPHGTQGVRPTGRHRSLAVFAGAGPDEVVIVGADLVYDDTVGALTLVYLGWDARNLTAGTTKLPGSVSVNIARSASGGGPLGGRS